MGPNAPKVGPDAKERKEEQPPSGGGDGSWYKAREWNDTQEMREESSLPEENGGTGTDLPRLSDTPPRLPCARPTPKGSRTVRT